jgi:hypothetical protein
MKTLISSTAESCAKKRETTEGELRWTEVDMCPKDGIGNGSLRFRDECNIGWGALREYLVPDIEWECWRHFLLEKKMLLIF